MFEIYETQDNNINLYSKLKLFEEPLRRNHILYLSWTLIMIFLISINVIHSTIYNSLIISIISILFLVTFIYFNYINLKI